MGFVFMGNGRFYDYLYFDCPVDKIGEIVLFRRASSGMQAGIASFSG